MIRQKLEQLSVLGLQPSVIDGWGVVIPAKYSLGRWIASDDEVQEIGRQYGGLYILATDQNKTYQVDETGELRPLISSEVETMPDMPDINTIELAGFTLTPVLHEAISRAMDNRGLAFGINRIVQTSDGYDGEIIAMSQSQGRYLMSGYTAKSALNYRRSQYIWGPDLDALNRDWSQGLTANEPNSTIELSYRSFDPRLGLENTQQWKQYTNQYQLIDDGIGVYQLAYTIGSEECRSPVTA